MIHQDGTRQIPQKIDPKHPLSEIEKQMHGADAVRCKYTGWPISRSSGSWPPEMQMEANKFFYERGTHIPAAVAKELADKAALADQSK